MSADRASELATEEGLVLRLDDTIRTYSERTWQTTRQVLEVLTDLAHRAKVPAAVVARCHYEQAELLSTHGGMAECRAAIYEARRGLAALSHRREPTLRLQLHCAVAHALHILDLDERAYRAFRTFVNFPALAKASPAAAGETLIRQAQNRNRLGLHDQALTLLQSAQNPIERCGAPRLDFYLQLRFANSYLGLGEHAAFQRAIEAAQHLLAPCTLDAERDKMTILLNRVLLSYYQRYERTAPAVEGLLLQSSALASQHAYAFQLMRLEMTALQFGLAFRSV